MIGWIVAGSIIGALFLTAIDRFWNSIAEWLNNVAADAVEKVLGYNAKRFMHKAVSSITRVRDMIKNRTTIYTKKDALDTHFHKVTLVSDAPVYEQEEEVIEQLDREQELIKPFEYKV